MKKSISSWQMVGFIFTAVAGSLLHFLFDWTGGSAAAALVSAVNESIWEHLKLLFYPMVAIAVVEYFAWGKAYYGFWCVKLMGITLGLMLIPVVYYTYTGILGINADWFNVTLFFLTAAAVYWLETKLLGRGSCRISNKLAMMLICLMGVVFVVFTFLTPRIPFFRDPITGTYGFAG